MESEVTDCFELLLSVCQAEDVPLKTRYKQMRDLLERVCREQMRNESLQMTDLSAKINYVAAKTGLTSGERNRLHTFRLTSNKVLNHQEGAGQEGLLRDAKTLALFIRKVYRADIPKQLYKLLPQADAAYLVKASGKRVAQRMRVCYQYKDERYLYVIPADSVAEEPLRVRYNVPEINDEFKETCEQIWPHAQLNLLDVSEDAEGILTPRFIVLEPDYLLDISTLAECYKDYGHHPLNYQLAKLQPMQNARPVLLGNIVNLFLDEWIYTDGEPDYMECMRKAFRTYPIELAACKDLLKPDQEAAFFSDCRKHFEHLRQTVQETFRQSGYQLDRTDAVLEPSYICEALGLQGRLDYMQRDMRTFIEMKSGKADEFSIRNKVTSKENHKVQMLLYQAVLEYAMGMNHKDVTPYLLYTRYPLLYPASSSWTMVRRVINLRNRIVADEYGIQVHNNTRYTADKIGGITADLLNERQISGTLWDVYLRPGIDRTVQALARLSETERAYFYSLYNFITKEQYTSKSGDVDYEGRTGMAALWLSTLEEKRESGEILYDLRITDNHASNEHKAYVILEKEAVISPEEAETLPNFRPGDAVVLYRRNLPSDNVTNKMVFKGNIEQISGESIRIRLRATQHNPSVLPMDSLYAVEHDSMDTAFRAMFLGLSSFLFANQERRDLLLGKRLPEFDDALDQEIRSAEDDFTRIALKAKAARDYFLLVGPPGTGKTSRALRKMVETFYAEPDTRILLLAYTNKAVDEICKALKSIDPAVDFIRLGSELSCEPAYREYLIENVLSACNRRSEVNERIARCRIFAGTVTTLSGKQEIFRLKRFDVAIVDEATQILEPQILGLLCHCNDEGQHTIGKFILIGDHKQLPAVVLQSSAHTAVHDESLRAIGMENLKDSLFERLYRRTLKARNTDQAWSEKAMDMLRKQGRMHRDILLFPNYAFYQGGLKLVPMDHQERELSFNHYDPTNGIETLLSSRRLAFIVSHRDTKSVSNKVNCPEAKIIAATIHSLWTLYKKNEKRFDKDKTVGVIVPYRNQIAMIRNEISKYKIEKLLDITIDTVERYQGSERDVIVYGFTIQHDYQLDFLTGNTFEEEDGSVIDRKLNVALTRAREQLILIGDPLILNSNLTFYKLIEFIRSKQGYFDIPTDDYSKGNFIVPAIENDFSFSDICYNLTLEFENAFDKLVLQPIKNDSRTEWPSLIFGNDRDKNREIIDYGRADFSNQLELFGSETFSAADKVLLYCFYNMRMHYCSAKAVYETMRNLIKTYIDGHSERVLFYDIGCGPGTGGLAFADVFQLTKKWKYIGVDISIPMIQKATEFFNSEGYKKVCRRFIDNFMLISDQEWKDISEIPTLIIFNYSFFFANVNVRIAEQLADRINEIENDNPLNTYLIINQNSPDERKNKLYKVFKEKLLNEKFISKPKQSDEVKFKYKIPSGEKESNIYYDIISNRQ